MASEHRRMGKQSGDRRGARALTSTNRRARANFTPRALSVAREPPRRARTTSEGLLAISVEVAPPTAKSEEVARLASPEETSLQ